MNESTFAMTFSLLSFLLAVIWGGPLIKLLKHFHIGKLIRVEGPQSHMTKMGTPTMGGLMFIIPVVLVTFLMNAANVIGLNIIGRSILLPVLTLIAFGVLGAIDDWEGIRGPRRGLGMRARTKLIFQIILAAIIAFTLKFLLQAPELFWPGYVGPISLGWAYIPLAIFLIVGMSNAVNFTDGLDGLAGLICVTAFAVYGGIALLQDQIFVARFCFTLVGALFAFLWFNVHPAQMIMGDAGALSLGAVLAVVALMTGRWLLLPIIAIIPVSEALSVTIQIAYFRLTKGKRFFKMAPIHHHFELLGWSETQIVQRFWLVGLLFGILGLAVALV